MYRSRAKPSVGISGVSSSFTVSLSLDRYVYMATRKTTVSALSLCECDCFLYFLLSFLFWFFCFVFLQVDAEGNEVTDLVVGGLRCTRRVVRNEELAFEYCNAGK